MKKIILILSLICSLTHAIIIESDDIRTVLHYVYDTHHHKEILVVFDIDNTVAHVTDGFGGDEWFSAMLADRIAKGTPINPAINELLPTYIAIQKSTWLDLVQPETAKMIRFLQESGIAVIALTARSLPLKNRTVEQLAHLSVDFNLSTPCQESFYFSLQDGIHVPAYYENGIIFSGNNDKGKLLLEFFSRIEYQPQKVIFVDDKLKYASQVDSVITNAGIPSICIRYSHLDQKVRNFKLEDHQHRFEQFIAQ